MTSTEAAGGDYAAINVAHWDRHADSWVEAGERMWLGEPEWGIWGVPNSEVPLIADDLTGFSAIELGCGTGYGSAWMARRGAAVVGIDPSSRQLDTARRLAAEHDIAIEFVQAFAESVPFPAESFDFALSEYGAAIWADPHAWIPEAHRLLRLGGRLAFLGTGSWNDVFTPRALDGVIGETALRPYFGMHRIEWVGLDDDPSIEFNLPISAWFRLFRSTGFEVEGFYEIRPPDDVDEVRFGIDPAWARKYPSEQAWIVRKAV